jgi:YVTN family beta-propeller protein
VARVPLIAAIVLAALAASTPAHASPLAYVAQGGFDPSGAHALAVFDVATGAPITSIDMPGAARTVTIAPDGTRAYVATAAGLVVVDLTTNAIVAGPVADAFGGDLAVDPAGKRVYLADGQSKVRLFDTATNTLSGSITVSDPQPRAIVANSAGTRAYTGNNDPPSYSIDTVDLTNDTNPVSTASGNFSRPENLGILPDGSKIYAANFGPGAGGNTVAIFDPVAVTVDSVTVGTTPTAAVANPSGTKVYVANRDSASISVIDVASSTVVNTFPVGFAATYIGIAPDGVHAVLSSVQDGKLAFIDLATGQLYAGPTALSDSAGVAVAPAQTPVPSFAVRSGLSGDPTSFDASGSGGGPVARYDWDFGDGATAPDGAAKLTHVYAKAGTYDAKVTETNQCDPSAFVGPLGVVFAGHSPYCRGARTDSKTTTVTIPRAAVGVVVSNRPKASGKGVVGLRLACVKELACRGTLSLKTTKKFKIGKRPRARVALGSKKFGKVAAGNQRTIKLKLSRVGLGLLRSHKKLAATATVRVPNPGGIVRVRSHDLALRRG